MRRTAIGAALTATVVLLVVPAALGAVSVTRAELSGGQLRVEGSGAAPNATVTVTSPESTAGRAGDGSGSFRVEASGFSSSTCQATVSDGTSSVQVTLSGCTPASAPPSQPTLSSVSFAPANVAGGGSSTGTVTFNAATDGAVVSLSSSNPAVASVPAEVVVNGGQSSGAFPVTTTSVISDTLVTVTATAFGVTRTSTLTVSAAASPPAADTVAIQRAEWAAGLLRIEATSTNPNAILSVYLTASDSFMFTLTNLEGGRYSAQRPWVFSPESITVKSNFGGSATKAVIKK